MRRALLLGLLLAAAGCGGGDTTPDATFIALQRDFQQYPAWEHFHLDQQENVQAGDPHAAGARDIYLHSRPPKGSTAFPVGTIIVKHSDGAGTTEGPRTFAMVKRGGGYNRAGAPDWEWFELLQDDTTQAWVITWRGIGPPLGGEYGSSGATCNECHLQAKSNDYVQAPQLQLGTLAQ